MVDFLKLLIPVFLSSKDYPEMLKKLAAFLFWEAFIATFVLRGIPKVDMAFSSVDLSLIPGHEHLNLFGFVVSLAIACLSYAIQLHDRISDIFGIRYRFDRNYILLPLAVLVGVRLSPHQLNALSSNRDSLLRRVFYPYVSSRAEHPLVDRHDIERALDAWSWYWILIEAIPLALLGALVSAGFGSYSLLTWFSWISVGLWVAASLYYLRVPRFTRPEIEAIAASQAARLNITEAFGAL
jgi:hypothetical protein